jgi:hypothetical protein
MLAAQLNLLQKQLDAIRNLLVTRASSSASSSGSGAGSGSGSGSSSDVFHLGAASRDGEGNDGGDGDAFDLVGTMSARNVPSAGT